MSHATVGGSDEPWAATRPWTVEDLAQTPDDGQRYEIIDGGLYVSPPPAPRHQGIAHFLAAAMNRKIEREWLAVEGVGVVLRRGESTRMVMPDIAVVPRGRVWAPDKTIFETAELALAVEIVSPSSVSTDRVLKPTLLAEAGVPAYWRVEQEAAGLRVFLHRLVGDVYKEDDVVRAGEEREMTWPVTCRLAPSELTG